MCLQWLYPGLKLGTASGVPMFDSKSCIISVKTPISTRISTSLLSSQGPSMFPSARSPLCGSVYACPHGGQRPTACLLPPHRFWETPVIGLGGKHSYTLSHLTSSVFLYFNARVQSPNRISHPNTEMCLESLLSKPLGEAMVPPPSICLLVSLVCM